MLPYNNTCTVYHGTNLFSAKVILYYGIMLHTQRELTDFGKGFYVTFNLKQVKDWARIKARNPQVYPTMLEILNISKNQYLSHPDTRIPVYLAYEIDLNRLLTLSGVVFPMPYEPMWSIYKESWETFVKNCRNGVKHNYDFVYGPIGGRHPNGTYQAKSSHVKEQLSLHTTAATCCLSNLRIVTLASEVKPPKKPTTEQLYSHIGSRINTIEFRNQFLREISKYIKHIAQCSREHANRLVERSWVASQMNEHESIFTHESAAYWAFSILYGDQSLWYRNYEIYMTRENATNT